ncbi:MAG: nucleoside diphosphate kinase regulator [Thermoanaerobaculia bacterium]|nr:nucleoside diphosphate kinase regulator [Thermoanaerobaculia bacterium]MCZ7649820.1 nucleoside diphosphate kinase regulator [Thermoanaerobaculia bacterium]
MSERQIFVTSEDRKRLEALLDAPGAALDREDMRDLARELRRATVVPAVEIPADVITMNSTARLVDLDDGAAHLYTVVYPQDANFSEGKISVLAPVGAAMLGYRVGDEIEWMVPAGLRRLRVEEVVYQPEAAGDFTR